jgi:mono/diheme cytochrome c family protein
MIAAMLRALLLAGLSAVAAAAAAQAVDTRVGVLQEGRPVAAALRFGRLSTYQVATPFVLRVAGLPGRALPRAIQVCASRDRRIFDQVKPGLPTGKAACFADGTGIASSGLNDDPRRSRLFLSSGDGHNYYNSLRRVDGAGYSDIFVTGIAESPSHAVGTVYAILFVDDNGDEVMDDAEFAFLELAVVQQAAPAAPPGRQARLSSPASWPPAEQAVMRRGQQLYNLNCVACHQSLGQGVRPAFPPLAGARVLADKRALIEAVLYPAPRTAMPSSCRTPVQDIAAVLTYIINAWSEGWREGVKPLEVLEVARSMPDRPCETVLLNP